jgi:hypothetical protein
MSRPHSTTRAYPVAHRRIRPGRLAAYARPALEETIRAGIDAPTAHPDAPKSSTVDLLKVVPTNVARQPPADATTVAVPVSPCPTLNQNGSADTQARNAPASPSSTRNGSPSQGRRGSEDRRGSEGRRLAAGGRAGRGGSSAGR